MELDKLVGHSVKHNASDLHLCPGRPPIIRVDGLLRPLAAPALTESDIASCVQRYRDARQRGLLSQPRGAGAGRPCRWAAVNRVRWRRWSMS